jgi:hypothetical protein
MFQDVSQTTKNTDLMLDNVKVTTTAGPVITSQPHNAAGQVGGTASFSVGATGTPTITYQWRFNSGGGWNDIPGATASTYTINSVQNSNAGSYEVVVSDQSGQPPVTSSAATLTILPPGVPVNGSFEFDYTGWTATGNQAVVSGAPFTATDGVKAVAFNVGDQPPNGVLMQTISTAVGQSYALTFDVGAFSTVTQNEQRLQVTVQGANGALVGPQVISVFAPGNGTTYVSETVNFVADGSNATLIFQDVSQTTASTDLMLDNVKVTATNLGGFTNGSFESGLTGWTSSGNLNVDTSPPYAPTDGAHLLVFNGGQTAPNGVLSQTFATSPGQSYTLAFDVGAFSAVNQNQQRLQVSVVGPGNTSLLAPPVITVSAPGNGTAWVAQSFNFTANGTSATVTFQDVSQTTTNVDLVLDNVRVQ